jgi:hypothetical protein
VRNRVLGHHLKGKQTFKFIFTSWSISHTPGSTSKNSLNVGLRKLKGFQEIQKSKSCERNGYGKSFGLYFSFAKPAYIRNTKPMSEISQLTSDEMFAGYYL